jgi:hypothetical protein
MSEAALATPPANPTPANAPAAIPAMDLAGSEAFGALEEISKDDGQPESPPATPPPKAPDKPATPPRDPTGKFAKEPDKSKQAAKAAPKSDKGTPAPIDFENPPGTIGDLRKYYDALKAHAKELEAKAKDYEAKHVELQKKLSEPRDWPEKKSYEEKLSEREKRLQEYESNLRATRYEKSQEYKEKYETPYVNAFMAGRQKAAAMKVVERKDESGAITIQPARQGKAEDFDEIFRIQDDDAAADRAVELFGEARAPMILIHRELAQEKRNAGLNAIAEMGKKGEQWEKEQKELSERQLNEANTLIDNFRNLALEKYPALFKEVDGDTKGNELLSKGKHLLDRVLQHGKPLANGEEQMTHEELAIAIAAVRNKAAGFDRLVYKLRTVEKERDEIKKKLEAFEQSEPGPGDGGGRTTTPEDADDPFAALDKMAKER